MSKFMTMKLVAAGALLVGVFAGAAGAQLVRNQQSHFIGTSLFRVERGETVNFHVTLEDNRGASPAPVVLRLLNARGTVVAAENVTLQPGQSATLETSEEGTFRAQAQIFEPQTASARRRVLGGVELFDMNSLTTKPRFVCSFGDNAGGGRLPD